MGASFHDLLRREQLGGRMVIGGSGDSIHLPNRRKAAPLLRGLLGAAEEARWHFRRVSDRGEAQETDSQARTADEQARIQIQIV